MKITQYCSVCKQSLAMEVVATDEGDEDGVIWLRCPQCRGFLPRISGEGVLADDQAVAEGASGAVAESPPGKAPSPQESRTGAMPKQRDVARDGDARGSRRRADGPHAASGSVDEEATATAARAEEARRLAAYADELAEKDPANAISYRPWNTYAVGDLIHHLAWDDVGLVVGKQTLPGNRRVVEVYFEEKGVVRLIEADSRKP